MPLVLLSTKYQNWAIESEICFPLCNSKIHREIWGSKLKCIEMFVLSGKLHDHAFAKEEEMTAACQSTFPLLKKQRGMVTWALSCGETSWVCSAAESPELKGLKCPRKLGTWLMSALAEHLTRQMNTEHDSKVLEASFKAW